MSERTVYVTGGSKGIGFSIVKLLSERGFSVVAVARHSTAELADLQANGTGRVRYLSADLTTKAGQNFASIDIRSCSTIYGLVNNAGMATTGLHVGLARESAAEMWALNVEAPMLLSQAAVKAMRRSCSGRVINISSICAHKTFRGLGAYTATKAALEGFSRVLAAEVGVWGITVNCVAPGFIETEMTLGLPLELRSRIKERNVLGHPASATDVASMVDYLLSPAGNNLTAQVIKIDSGATA